MNYYNEIDLKTAAWLRELISQGRLPPGDVDTRSITEVKPDDIKHYTQCHFFAGIGGWSYALALAGWDHRTPVWTGSCPCQPFSTAGKGLAQSDERHLWPAFFELIRQCRPEHVFGEQVASAIGHGWLDGVSSDLEAEGYACGATVLGAHSVSSPHQRQRLYWVAYAGYGKCWRPGEPQSGGQDQTKRSRNADSDSVQDDHGLVLSYRDGCGQGSSSTSPAGYRNPVDSTSVGADWLGQPKNIGRAGGNLRGNREPSNGIAKAGVWSDFQLVHCRDGKTRRIPSEPAFFPLAHGVPARVVRLRGYGNAIVPQVAAEFVSAYLEIVEG